MGRHCTCGFEVAKELTTTTYGEGIKCERGELFYLFFILKKMCYQFSPRKCASPLDLS
jgi:hypothetical protein